MRRLQTKFSFTVITAALLVVAAQWLGSAPTSAQTIKIKVNGGAVHLIDSSETGKAPFVGEKSAVDVAILLDTSNSMDGLISQARGQLWNIVQEFAKAEKAGQTPVLRVAVFEYGNSRLSASDGYIRQVQSLTTNLDNVSKALFSLQTSGGEEYCGQVIQECLKRLDWNTGPGSYKAIFVAGNEPFTQGGVDYQKVCKQAIQSGVVVNTIHCGAYQQGVSGKWQHGAQLAEGEYFNINQDQNTVQIKCPQDERLLELNIELNQTYLWYGQRRERGLLSGNQLEQDRNSQLTGNAASRVAAKASTVYDNEGRDLVDTFADNEAELDSIGDDLLPESMQAMNKDQRAAHVKQAAKKRESIKRLIADLSKQRTAYIEAQRQAGSGSPQTKTLGQAMTESVRKQLIKSGYKMAQPE